MRSGSTSWGRFVRRWTSAQWKAIDERYAPQTRLNGRVAAVLVLCTVVLILLHYLGTSQFLDRVMWLRTAVLVPGYGDLGAKLYWAACRLLGYVGVPALVIWGVFGERLSDYGMRVDREPRTVLLYVGLFVAVVPIVFAASFANGFIAKYPFYAGAGSSLTGLVIWETAYGLQFFALEFFFRGFLLFSLARVYGATAIFIMVVPYTMIHFTKPLAETLGAMIAGIALGTLALRTRSIFGGVAIHTAVGWSMDLFALYQKSQLGNLF